MSNPVSKPVVTPCKEHTYSKAEASTTISSNGVRHTELVHRYLYRSHYGYSRDQIASIQVVRLCGNPRCVAIDHMTHTGELTTVTSSSDALAAVSTVIAPEIARSIAKQKASGKSYQRLADTYGLTVGQVKQLVTSYTVNPNRTGYEYSSKLK